MPRLNQTDDRSYRAKRNTMEIQDSVQEEETIDLVGLFYRLLENLKYIIAVAIIGAVLTGVWTVFFITPQYKATAKLYVLNPGESAINLSDLQIGTYLTSDYQEVFHNWIVHERVIQSLSLPYSYEQLAGMLTVTNPNNTRILYITIVSDNAYEAKAIADMYAKIAQEFIASTMDTKEPNLFEEALLPTAPFAPSKTRNIALGFIVGLFLTIGVITVRYITNDKIQSSEDIEKFANLATLGTLPIQKEIAAKIIKGQDKGKGKQKRSSAKS